MTASILSNGRVVPSFKHGRRAWRARRLAASNAPGTAGSRRSPTSVRRRWNRATCSSSKPGRGGFGKSRSGRDNRAAAWTAGGDRGGLPTQWARGRSHAARPRHLASPSTQEIVIILDQASTHRPSALASRAQFARPRQPMPRRPIRQARRESATASPRSARNDCASLSGSRSCAGGQSRPGRLDESPGQRCAKMGGKTADQAKMEMPARSDGGWPAHGAAAGGRQPRSASAWCQHYEGCWPSGWRSVFGGPLRRTSSPTAALRSPCS